MSARWFLVYTRPQQEPLAKHNLERQGFSVFWPGMPQPAQPAGRRAAVPQPLLPQYLFVAFDPAVTRAATINGTRGVRHLCSRGAQPLPCPDRIVAAVRSLHGSAGAEAGESALAGQLRALASNQARTALVLALLQAGDAAAPPAPDPPPGDPPTHAPP